jgi:hypothetical protein
VRRSRRTSRASQSCSWSGTSGTVWTPDDLTRVQAVDTPDARALVDRLKRDIAAVFRAAGFHYPVVPPVDRDWDARLAILWMLEELRLETKPLNEIATLATEQAERNRAESREAIRRAEALRVEKMHS